MPSLRSLGIRNIAIFVCDALRWDATPRELTQSGMVFKTVASSLFTALSFPSIVSGLYPPRHGVETWQDKLHERLRGLLSFDGYHTSLWDETTWPSSFPGPSPLRRILGYPPKLPLSRIPAPFIFLEHDKGGHCPYGIPLSTEGRAGCPEFFDEYGRRGVSQLRASYRAGVEQSLGRFRLMVSTLKSRSLLDSTLVVFTSDHGELLGEYGGLTGHGKPACPEVVYVPTIMFHPSLPAGVSASGAVIRHVDLLPTIADLLDIPVPYAPDGVSLLDAAQLPSVGFSFVRGPFVRKHGLADWAFRGLLPYNAESAWDAEGGHVFHRHRTAVSVAYYVQRMLSSRRALSPYMKQRLRTDGLRSRGRACRLALRHLTLPYVAYGEPVIGRTEASSLIQRYVRRARASADGMSRRAGSATEESPEVAERLSALGYID